MTSEPRAFELRTYVAAPGRLDALLARFRDHTLALFEKHGMANIGYWVEADEAGQPTETLVYLLAHPDRDAAERAWVAFRADPDWNAAKTSSEVDGPLTASITSVFLEPTDFSELR